MSYIADNKEIISNIIKRIEDKKDVKQNIINKFFIESNIKANNIYPTVNYRYNNIQDQMNMPINTLSKPLSNPEELDLNTGDQEVLFRLLNDEYYLSEQSLIDQDLVKYIDVARNNDNSDILEFQDLTRYIVQNASDYKKTLKDINGEDFEHLVALISQGNNLQHIMNMEYIPYDQIKTKMDKEISDKDAGLLLKTRSVNRQNYGILKKYYSTSSGKSLYDIFNLNDRNTRLFFEKINVINATVQNKKGKYVKPKTDIMVTFFTLDKNEPVSISYKNRKIFYNDTLNISLKQNTFIGFQNTSIDFENPSVANIISLVRSRISQLTNDSKLGQNIGMDCVKTLKRKYPDVSNINKLKITITPNHLGNMDFAIAGKNDVFTYNTFSNRKLGELDPSSDFNSSLKFLYGNFDDSKGNSNALLHVKNQTSLGNINDLLNKIQPISLYNQDLIEQIKKLNLAYSFTFEYKIFFTFDRIQKVYSQEEIKECKLIIYDKNKPIKENTRFNKYLFKSLDDLYDFSYQIMKKLSIVNKVQLKQINAMTMYETIYFKILKHKTNKVIGTIYNTENKQFIPVYKVSVKRV